LSEVWAKEFPSPCQLVLTTVRTAFKATVFLRLNLLKFPVNLIKLHRASPPAVDVINRHNIIQRPDSRGVDDEK